MTNNLNNIAIGTTTGAIIGGIYGFRNPSEKTFIKLSKLGLSTASTLKVYRDCFDMLSAGTAVRSGNLTLDEYRQTNNIRTAIHNVFEKEKQIMEIANTPFEQRTKTLQEAIKEANEARPNLYKEMFNFNNRLRTKLIENNVFDNKKFLNAMENMAKKSFIALKEVSKGALKWLGIGAITGAIIGYLANIISEKK